MVVRGPERMSEKFFYGRNLRNVKGFSFLFPEIGRIEGIGRGLWVAVCQKKGC